LREGRRPTIERGRWSSTSRSCADRIRVHVVDADFPFDDTDFMRATERILAPVRATPQGEFTSFADERVLQREDLGATIAPASGNS